MTGHGRNLGLAMLVLGVASFTYLTALTGCGAVAPSGGGEGEPECAEAGEACNMDADCCDGLVCGDDGLCVEEEVPECAEAGEACETDADCCDDLICGDDGVCVEEEVPECAEAGEACEADADCCDDLVCGDDGLCVEAPTPGETFPTSLHDSNFRGMEYFWSADNGGFEAITDVPYTDERLDCATCHDKSRFENADPPVEWPGTDSCLNCHDDLSDPSAGIDDARCLGCHSRQGAEATALGISDVHRDAGFTCMSCHTLDEMHGDGTEYDSILESPSPMCQDCHMDGGPAAVPPPSVTEHATHLQNIDCSACHMQSVIACYNCHFDTQLAGAGKRAFAKRSGWVMLVNRDDKVHGATFQSLVYEQNTFTVIAPYYAHTITNQGRTCDQCHANFGGEVPAIDEYNASGTMTLTTWDDMAEGAARLTGPAGIIPVPEDWDTAFQFAWLDYTGDPTTPVPDTEATLWVNIENGPPAATQMLFAEPLTDAQMQSLGATP